MSIEQLRMARSLEEYHENRNVLIGKLSPHLDIVVRMNLIRELGKILDGLLSDTPRRYRSSQIEINQTLRLYGLSIKYNTNTSSDLSGEQALMEKMDELSLIDKLIDDSVTLTNLISAIHGSQLESLINKGYVPTDSFDSNMSRLEEKYLTLNTEDGVIYLHPVVIYGAVRKFKYYTDNKLGLYVRLLIQPYFPNSFKKVIEEKLKSEVQVLDIPQTSNHSETLILKLRNSSVGEVDTTYMFPLDGKLGGFSLNSGPNISENLDILVGELFGCGIQNSQGLTKLLYLMQNGYAKLESRLNVIRPLSSGLGSGSLTSFKNYTLPKGMENSTMDSVIHFMNNLAVGLLKESGADYNFVNNYALQVMGRDTVSFVGEGLSDLHRVILTGFLHNTLTNHKRLAINYLLNNRGKVETEETCNKVSELGFNYRESVTSESNLNVICGLIFKYSNYKDPIMSDDIIDKALKLVNLLHYNKEVILSLMSYMLRSSDEVRTKKVKEGYLRRYIPMDDGRVTITLSEHVYKDSINLGSKVTYGEMDKRADTKMNRDVVVDYINLFYPLDIFKRMPDYGRIRISFENKIELRGDNKVPMLTEYNKNGYKLVDSYMNSYTYKVNEDGELSEVFGNMSDTKKTGHFIS